jgi:CRISPR-associated protein Csd1
MGFWQHLADSYDKNADALKKTYPLSTTSISNNSDIIAVIVIDGDGSFVRSDKIAKNTKPTEKNLGNPLVNITIPASEESMGRTGSKELPYPVFDQYAYLKGSGKKYDAYIAQLKNFAESEFATKQIMAIHKYVAKGTVSSDLSEMKVKDKTNIIFQVEIPGNPQTKVWKDETFFNAWHEYYMAEKGKLAERKKRAENELADKKKLPADQEKRLRQCSKLKDNVTLDYVTGVEQLIATSHPKKISKASPNSKLVSDNDTTNYTFRGKFSDSSEAVSIGYETSQKAHQFLRYLINDPDRRYYCGDQVILSFTIGSMEKLLPPPIEDKSIWALLQNNSVQTESDIQIHLRAKTGFDYADALRKSLGGFGHGQALKQHTKTAVIALDAATTGRLSITFYRELDKNEYLERVANWHSSCKWHQRLWDKVKEKYIPYLGAPSVDKIIEAVHGKPRGGKDESYRKIKKAARERLLRCIFDGAFLPKDYVVAAVRRAANPLAITKKGKFDRNRFEQIASTACALVCKDFQQRNEEDFKLSIEIDRTDRDYLYGRLLGAADKLEEYALYKKNNDRVVTAAIRYMQAFVQRPFRTWQTIHGCLNPYIQTVKGGFEFNEIQTVTNQFATGDYEKDTPLNGSYLIGYYHERAYIDSLVNAATEKKKQSTDLNKQEDNNDGQ